MKRFLALCAAFAALSFAPAQAQPAPETPASMLSFFQGCWRGDFAGQAGVTDERCFTPALGGRVMRDAHTVRGAPEPYAGETLYFYDGEARRIAYIYFAADGGVVRGSVRKEGAVFVFPEDRYVGPDGTVMVLRSRWTPDGPDRYVAITEGQQGGAWREMMRITFTRAPDLRPQ